MENLLGSQVSYTDTFNVAACQTVLNNVLNLHPPLEIDGKIGPKTRAAVIEFQKKHGLIVDGIIGPQTSRALQWSSSSRNSALYSLNDENSWVKSFTEHIGNWFDNYLDNLAEVTGSLLYKVLSFYLGGVAGEKNKNREIFSSVYKKICNREKSVLSNTHAVLKIKLRTPSKEEKDLDKEYKEAAKKRNSKNNAGNMSEIRDKMDEARYKRLSTIGKEMGKVEKPLKKMESCSAFLKKLEKEFVEAFGKNWCKTLNASNTILEGLSLVSSLKPVVSYINQGKWKKALQVAYDVLMDFLKDIVAVRLAYAAAGVAMAAIAGSVSILSGPGIAAIIAAVAIGVCVYFAVKYILDRIQEGMEAFVKYSYEKLEVEFVEPNREFYMYIEEGAACTVPGM